MQEGQWGGGEENCLETWPCWAWAIVRTLAFSVRQVGAIAKLGTEESCALGYVLK